MLLSLKDVSVKSAIMQQTRRLALWPLQSEVRIYEWLVFYLESRYKEE